MRPPFPKNPGRIILGSLCLLDEARRKTFRGSLDDNIEPLFLFKVKKIIFNLFGFQLPAFRSQLKLLLTADR